MDCPNGLVFAERGAALLDNCGYPNQNPYACLNKELASEYGDVALDHVREKRAGFTESEKARGAVSLVAHLCRVIRVHFVIELYGCFYLKRSGKHHEGKYSNKISGPVYMKRWQSGVI